MQCGKYPGGENADLQGICPASLPCGDLEGVNKGSFGGRVCWAVVGVLCVQTVNGQYSNKLLNCLGCEFLQQVYQEEGKDFILTPISSNDVEPRLQEGCLCINEPIVEQHIVEHRQ